MAQRGQCGPTYAPSISVGPEEVSVLQSWAPAVSAAEQFDVPVEKNSSRRIAAMLKSISNHGLGRQYHLNFPIVAVRLTIGSYVKEIMEFHSMQRHSWIYRKRPEMTLFYIKMVYCESNIPKRS